MPLDGSRPLYHKRTFYHSGSSLRVDTLNCSSFRIPAGSVPAVGTRSGNASLLIEVPQA